MSVLIGSLSEIDLRETVLDALDTAWMTVVAAVVGALFGSKATLEPGFTFAAQMSAAFFILFIFVLFFKVVLRSSKNRISSNGENVKESG